MMNDDIPLEDDINVGIYGLIRGYNDLISNELKSFKEEVEKFSSVIFDGPEEIIEKMKNNLVNRQKSIESNLFFYDYLTRNQDNDMLAEYCSDFDLYQSKLLGIELVKEQQDESYMKTIDIRYSTDPKFRTEFDKRNIVCIIPDFDENDPSYV